MVYNPEYNKSYYQKNKEKILRQNWGYRQRNKDKLKEYQKRKWLKNKSKFYDKCQCGNRKFFKSRKCRQCYIAGKHNTVSRAIMRERKKVNESIKVSRF
jgi:hypothetical protein